MDQQVWDHAAPQYDQEIFDTFANDRHKVLQKALDRLIDPSHTVCDFGCGVGRTVPFLARRARRVIATDFSPTSLEVAAETLPQLKNVQWLHRDLAEKNRAFCRADVGLLMQVLIMPDARIRQRILETVHRNLRKGASLVAVVPSLEVTLLTYQRIGQWYLRDGSSAREAISHMQDSAREEIVSLVEGIVNISDTPTKHYLREEALMLFRESGFRVLELEKIEYAWDADFEDAPRWMQDPYPWDWLIVARKA